MVVVKIDGKVVSNDGVLLHGRFKDYFLNVAWQIRP